MAICPKDLALFQPSTQSLTLPSWAGCPPTFQGVFSRVGKEDCLLGQGFPILRVHPHHRGARASPGRSGAGAGNTHFHPAQSRLRAKGIREPSFSWRGSRSPPRCAPLPGGRGTCRVLPPLPVRPSTRCAAPRMGAASPFLSVGHLTRSLSPRRVPVARPPSGRSWDGAVGTRPCLQPDSPRPPSSHPCPRRREGRGIRGPAGFLAGFGGGPLGRLGHKAAL